MANLRERFRNSWNAFRDRGQDERIIFEPSYVSTSRPDRLTLSRNNLKTIMSSLINRIAVDCSLIDVNHVRLNDQGQYSEKINSSLNDVLTKEANLDQTGRDLIRDIVSSMLDEGCVAVVPTVADLDPRYTDGYKIYEARVGKIVQWSPERVLVELYNSITGMKVQMWFEKRTTVIIENPFYAIMNDTNSTGQRLIKTLNQLDKMNTQASSGKLDLIIQLPYVVKTKAVEMRAEHRRRSVETQLADSQYGIAYIDGTERVIQLNRSIENNIWEQAEKLKTDLLSQLGISQSILDQTADEQTMQNYYSTIIEPIMCELVENMERKWISKTAQTQKQAIRYFRNPLRLTPASKIAELADKLTRNEILSSNEVRSSMGYAPSKDPQADMLRNANLNHPEGEDSAATNEGNDPLSLLNREENQNG